MALTLNGSTGISGIAGSAGTPALQGNNDANTGYFFATDTLGLSTAGSQRLRIDSSGNVGINNTNPAAYGKFVVNGTANIISLNALSGAGSLSFFESGQGRFYIKTLNGSKGLAFVDGDNSSERLRIDSSGRILIGHTTSLDQHATVQSFTSSTDTFAGFKYGDNSAPNIIRLGKSRNASVGGNTVVQNNDEIGRLLFSGNNGTDYNDCAAIQCYSDGTPGSSDMPGRLILSTTPDGSGSLQERLRIDSSGYVGIKETSPSSYYCKDLVLKCAAAEGGMTIRSNATTDTNYVMFADGTSGNEQYRGYIAYHHNAGTSGGEHIQLGVGGNTRIYRFYADGVALGGETAAANRLDDYEEGTWTPVLASTGTAFTSVTNWSTASQNRYTKIGRIVTVQCYHRTGGVDKGSAASTDGIHITGLPFTPTNNVQRTMVPIGQNVNWAGYPNQALVRENIASVELYKYANSGGNNTGTPLTVADVGTGSNANYAIFTLVYESD